MATVEVTGADNSDPFTGFFEGFSKPTTATERGDPAPETQIDIGEFVLADLWLNVHAINPRQLTFLRVVTLDVANLTPYDYSVIEEWERTWVETGNEGTPPGLVNRMWTCIAEGRPWFREVVLPVGRRGSKGWLGAILGCWVIWKFMEKGNVQNHFGIDPNKRLSGMVFAPKKEHAKANQWRDISLLIQAAPCFQDRIAVPQTASITLKTRADVERMKKLSQRNSRSELDMASFEVVAKESTGTAGRGPAGFLLYFDEGAHMVASSAADSMGTRSMEQIYEASVPALDQFGLWGFIYSESSPWQKIGKFWDNYLLCQQVDEETGDPMYPEMFTLQLPSWAQPLDAPVLTPTGWRTMGGLQVGDEVIGVNGQATRVLAVHPRGVQPIYRVTVSDGQRGTDCHSTVECTGDHLWQVHSQNQRWSERTERTECSFPGCDRDERTRASGLCVAHGAQKRSGNPLRPLVRDNRREVVRAQVLDTTSIQEMLLDGKDKHTFLPIVEHPVQYAASSTPLSIPAYALGALIGDGCLRQTPSLADLSSQISDLVIEDLRSVFTDVRESWSADHSYVQYVFDYERPVCSRKNCDEASIARELCSSHYGKAKYAGTLEQHPVRGRNTNALKLALKELGLWGKRAWEKFIPEEYLRSTPGDRLALLQGLMDTDGEVTKTGALIYHTTSEILRDHVADLVEGFGGTVTFFKDESYLHEEEKAQHACYRVQIRWPDRHGAPFRMARKIQRWEKTRHTEWRRREPHRKIVAVDYVGERPAQCITVEAEDGLYVTDHHVVTHNSFYVDYDLTGIPTEERPNVIKPYLTIEEQKQRNAEWEQDGRMDLWVKRWGKPPVIKEPWREWYPRIDKALLEYDEQMRRQEQANPETFRVERRAHFANVLDAYLSDLRVEQMFEPWDGRVLTEQHQGILNRQYVAHGDPSTVGKNFGWAIGHAERGPEADHRFAPNHQGGDACAMCGMTKDMHTGLVHVVIDLVRVWRPGDFEANNYEIDYMKVENDLWTDIEGFMPSDVSFDQFQATSTKQRLRTRVAQARHFAKQVQIHEVPGTRPLNWEISETFKGAIGLGLVHCYRGTEAAELLELECKFLQDKGGRVDPPTVGPVQTKDVFDAVSRVVHKIIGQQVMYLMREQFGEVSMLGSVSGGMPTTEQSAAQRLSQFGQAAASRGQMTRGGGIVNPDGTIRQPRRPPRGRPPGLPPGRGRGLR